MAWFAYYELTSGRLRSQGQSPVNVADLPDGWGRKEYPERPEGYDWNADTRDFDIEHPKRIEPITAIQFMRRFTVEERIAIRASRVGDPILDDFFDLLVVAGTVTPTDPDMVSGVNYLAQVGLITPGRVSELLEVSA